MPLSKIPECKSKLGAFKSGRLGKITDVPGVKVGHAMVSKGDIQSGVTVLLPCEENIYVNKFCAGTLHLNNVGKSVGLSLVRETGLLEAPIALTTTESISAVQEALSNYTQRRCLDEGFELEHGVNTIVCDCNTNMPESRDCENILTNEHVMHAIDSASENFAEGNTGAGSSVVTYGLSGGIGSASRILSFDNKEFCVGVLTMSNYGVLGELIAAGEPIGEHLEAKHGKCSRLQQTGNCITIIATDIPLTSRQLQRVLRRSSVAIARMGGKTDWEVNIGFTTANKSLDCSTGDFVTLTALSEHCLDKVICAAADAIEEAVLRSMLFAEDINDNVNVNVKKLSDLL